MLLRLSPKNIQDAHDVKTFFVESLEAREFVERTITTDIFDLDVKYRSMAYSFDIENSYQMELLVLSGYEFFKLYDINDFGELYLSSYNDDWENI